MRRYRAGRALPRRYHGSRDCQPWPGLLLSGHAHRVLALPSPAGLRQRGRDAGPRSSICFCSPPPCRGQGGVVPPTAPPESSSRGIARPRLDVAADHRPVPQPAAPALPSGLHAGRPRGRGHRLFKLRKLRATSRHGSSPARSAESAGPLASLGRPAIGRRPIRPVHRRSHRRPAESHGQSSGSG